MNLQEISEKLTKAEIIHHVDGKKIIVTHVYGTRKNYGYLVAGDDGSTGTCQGIQIQAGKIKQALRA